MIYLSDASGMNRMCGERNESVSGRLGMLNMYEEMKCKVFMFSHTTLRVFGHLEKMEENELTKKDLYKSGRYCECKEGPVKSGSVTILE